MRLTCHLGLVGCADTFVSVGDETRPYEDGKCVVFGTASVFCVCMCVCVLCVRIIVSIVYV